ncbi:hypothetical protein WMY93_025012 [Mugilogobius chulae]|uniref:VWFD domain-containing protein n=1 Tax=Mugilogobius chulae TaxID=88201 RepID=A0AAW0NC87_9GOBI
MELSKNKVAAKISWGEKCRTYDTMITAETGLVQNKMAARIRVAWKRLPSSVTKHAKMIYQRILASYLSSVSKQKRSDVTKQISLTAVVESEKLVNVILKSPAAIYKRNVALPVSLPIHSLNDQLPYNDVHNNLHYLLEKTTGPICRFERGQLTTFSNKRYENYMPDSCFQVLAQDCTSSLNFIVLLKKDSSNVMRSMQRLVEIGKDIDMRYNEERPTVTINGQEIARESLPYNKDSFKIELKNSNKLVLYAKEFGITELNFSNMEVELHILNDYRNRVCGLCGQANGDKRNDLRMPNGNLNDNPVSFVSSWTLPSQSCSDETGKRIQQLDKHSNSG